MAAGPWPVATRMSIAVALEALAIGSVVGLPTDTVYGIAADPFSETAVDALFEVKGRDAGKAIPILAADLDGLRRVADIPDEIVPLVVPHWPGGLTVVLRRAGGLPKWVGDSGADTIAVRIPDHPVALEVLGGFGPLAVTSANRSGESPATGHVEAEAALGDAIRVYLEGRGRGDVPSTVVDLTGPSPRILRAGAVEWGRS